MESLSTSLSSPLQKTLGNDNQVKSETDDLQRGMSRDLSRLYNAIYNNAKDIEADSALRFLAFNSLHLHNHAIAALKKLIDEKADTNRAFSLLESPLFALLLPIAAHEYGADLLGIRKFSSVFHSTIDNMLELRNARFAGYFNYMPCNYMVSALHRIDAVSRSTEANRQDGISRLLRLVQSTYPDHFDNSRTYLMGLIEAHGTHQSGNTLQIPIDSTFFRIFGHTIFQPDWITREFRIASSSFEETTYIPTFLKPKPNSLLGHVNRIISNKHILDGWIEELNRNQGVGRLMTLDELTEAYGAQRLIALFPYDYSLSEITTGSSLSTYNETGSSAYAKTKHIINLSLGDAISRLEPRVTKPRISNRKIAILHVRSSAFYEDISHRNSNIANYQPLCDYLYRQGYDIYNYSNPEMQNITSESIFNYYDYKTKKLDALIPVVADLIVSTPSGLGGTGRLFGTSELVTNFWPYIFDGSPSALKIIPKIVIDRELQRVLRPQEVITLTKSLGLSTLEDHPRYLILENSEQDLLLGIQDFQNGRMRNLSMFLPDSLASAPESFVKRYFEKIPPVARSGLIAS